MQRNILNPRTRLTYHVENKISSYSTAPREAVVPTNSETHIAITHSHAISTRQQQVKHPADQLIPTQWSAHCTMQHIATQCPVSDTEENVTLALHAHTLELHIQLGAYLHVGRCNINCLPVYCFDLAPGSSNSFVFRRSRSRCTIVARVSE